MKFVTTQKVFLLFALLLKFAHLGEVAAGNDSTTKKLYNGDQVLSLVPSTDEHLQWLRELFLNADPNVYDFWTEPSRVNVSVDIHVNKNALAAFCAELEAKKLSYKVSIPDLQKLIDSVNTDNNVYRQRREPVGGEAAKANGIVGTFPRYNDIVSYLESLCSSYSTLATCGVVGTSFEGRKIGYIKFAVPSGTGSKEDIFIDAGIHAREWLAIATSIYLINRLVTTYNSDATAKKMLDKYNFVFVPCVNPDGYEYTRTDRMWRKTRSKMNDSECYGVDPNRNYDSWWGTTGCSDNPCTDLYLGPKAFSEPETKAMSEFLLARGNKTLAYFTLHAYSQLWLVPYGDKMSNYPPDYDELLRVAKIGADALMAVNNKTWTVGNSAEIYGPTSGASDDYSKLIGVKYAYTLELRPADDGSDFSMMGFEVPESEIIPSGQEVWAGITAAVDAMQSANNLTQEDDHELNKKPNGTIQYSPTIINTLRASSPVLVDHRWRAFPALFALTILYHMLLTAAL